MTIEKVFAIAAEPGVIWDALWSDLAAGQRGSFKIEQSSRPSLLSLQVEIGGLPNVISYVIRPDNGGCEVLARLEPLSLRYRLLQFITLGRLATEYNLLLTQALANLKQAVEENVEAPGENS